jgi:hypothetical protein
MSEIVINKFSMIWITFLILIVAENLAFGADTEVTNVTACLLIERGNPRLLYDYDKAAAAIDLAVSYVNDNIFPPDLHLNTVYSDIGNSCGGQNKILSVAMNLWQGGVECAVYIGPGCGKTAENLYDFADFFQTPIIGCPAAGNRGRSDNTGTS